MSIEGEKKIHATGNNKAFLWLAAEQNKSIHWV